MTDGTVIDYRESAQHPFPKGANVYLATQIWNDAQDQGTATIIAVKSVQDGFKYQVQRHRPLRPGGINEPTWWGSERTHLARNQPPEIDFDPPSGGETSP